MFCPNCGKEVPDGAGFCPECGNKIATNGNTGNNPGNNVNTGNNGYGYFYNNPTNTAPNNNAAPKKASKKLIGVIIAAVAVLLIAVAMIFFITRPPKVTLSDYITVKASGYDGIGKATAKFNSEKFYKDYKGKIKFTSKGKRFVTSRFAGLNQSFGSFSDSDGTVALQLFGKCTTGRLNKSSELSNGDVIRYKWDARDSKEIEDYFNIRLDADSYEYTVSGLKKAARKDVFKDVKIKFSGVAPDGEAKVISAPKGIQYDFNKYEGLSNGNKVKLTVSMSSPDAFVKKYGYIPKHLSKTYKVSGLSKYLVSLDNLSADGLTAVQADAKAAIDKYISSDYSSDGITADGLAFVGNYLLTPKDNSSAYGTKNYLYCVFSATVSKPDSFGPVTVYYPVEMENTLENGDHDYSDIQGYSLIDTSDMFGLVPTEGYNDPAEMFKDLCPNNVNGFTYEVSDGLKQFGE